MNAGPTEAERDPSLVAERMVALTDFGLGVEAAAFALIIARHERAHGSALRNPLLTFFTATAAASLAGAALHGLTTDRFDPRRRALWRLSLGSIGVAALSSWFLGARLALSDSAARAVSRVASLGHAPYFAAVLRSDQPFSVAIVSYVPGAGFLAGALASRLHKRNERGPAALALAALGITFAAAAVQVGRIGLTRRFDHNALYHSLQAIGVAVFFLASKGMLSNPARGVRRADGSDRGSPLGGENE